MFDVHHLLGFALRFEDIFDRPATPTTSPVRAPLQVSIPALRWQAFYAGSDGTYRFRFGPHDVIAGTHAVEVTSLDGSYANHEAFTVTLPRVVSTPPVTDDFLIARPLWPTRSFRIPEGETAVIGRITSPTSQPVAGLRVQLYRGASPPPSGAYTYTDANGEFVFRLLKLGGLVPGGPITDIKIAVSDGGPIVVSPVMFTVDLGHAQAISFQRT
jgi:hypothetical protein